MLPTMLELQSLAEAPDLEEECSNKSYPSDICLPSHLHKQSTNL